VICDAGNVLLVRNIERNPLPASLRDVITDYKSREQVISIAGQPVSYHKDFRLILSSSVPIYVRGIYTVLRCFSDSVVLCYAAKIFVKVHLFLSFLMIVLFLPPNCHLLRCM